MKMKGREILDLLIESSYLMVVFLVPLSFSFWFTTYNIFELNKIIVFKVLVLLLLLLTLIKIVLYYPFPPFNQWTKKDLIAKLRAYWLIPLALLLGLGLSLFFSIDINKSLYGSYDRQAGWLSYLFYFLWFVLLSFNILSISNGFKRDSLEKRLKRIVVVAVSSGFLVAVYGILQVLNIDFLTWPEPPYLTHRTLSTFGQPNFLASFLLLITPLSFYLWNESRRFIWRFFYCLVAIIQLVCLFFTASRGALVAIVFIVLAFLVYLGFRSQFVRGKKTLIIVMGIILVVGGLIGVEKSMPGRISSFGDYQVGSLAARVNFYQAAANSIIKKPVFGYGLENGGEIFIKYYEADWAIHGDVDASTDRAHNLVLDILLTSGFWGLALFTLFYYAFFRLGLRNIVQKKNSNLSLALLLGAAAYLTSLLFSFSIVGGEVYLWLFFALIITLNFSDIKAHYSRSRLSVLKVITVLVIIFCCGYGIYGNLKILMADHYFNKLYYTFAQGDYLTASVLDDYIRESGLNRSQQFFYDRFLGDKLSDIYPDIKEQAPRTIIKNKLQIILEDLPDYGYENILVKAKIYATMENFASSEDSFAILNAHAPHWPRGYFELARMLAKKESFVPAIASYHLTELNLPDLNDERINDRHQQIILYYRYVIYKELGGLYQKENDYFNANKYYHLAYRNNPQDFTLLKKIADTYYLLGDIDLAIKYSHQGFTRSPQDYNWPLALAILYQQSGDNEKAQIFINTALDLEPEQELLQKLKMEYEQ